MEIARREFREIIEERHSDVVHRQCANPWPGFVGQQRAHALVRKKRKKVREGSGDAEDDECGHRRCRPVCAEPCNQSKVNNHHGRESKAKVARVLFQGQKGVPNSQAKAPPAYPSQKTGNASLAVAAGAIVTPRSVRKCRQC